jgi:hypothetical protein
VFKDFRSSNTDATAFSIGVIQILRASLGPESVPMNQDHNDGGSMKSEYPYSRTNGEKSEELSAPTSRFTDEKISDDSDTESRSDSALAPAGLKNPFWN